ncbi:hypothetical protein [Ideonella sp. YS5]|uniref:hypothetical protein n=1 Tax=Ideonella sp. YS5 TaxID=3453714 RepID=UPI003EEF16D3
MLYKKIISYDDTRTWQGQYQMPSDELLQRAMTALQAPPFSAVVSRSASNKLSAATVFPGRYEGIWPFGSRWDSILYIVIETAPVPNSTKTEVTLKVVHQERRNIYWGWQRVEEFGAAEPQFEKVARAVQATIETK